MRKERGFVSRNGGSWCVLSEAGEGAGKRSRVGERGWTFPAHEWGFILRMWERHEACTAQIGRHWLHVAF